MDLISSDSEPVSIRDGDGVLRFSLSVGMPTFRFQRGEIGFVRLEITHAALEELRSVWAYTAGNMRLCAGAGLIGGNLERVGETKTAP